MIFLARLFHRTNNICKKFIVVHVIALDRPGFTITNFLEGITNTRILGKTAIFAAHNKA